MLFKIADESLQIIHVKIPYNSQGTNKSQRHFAYVEFGDEESMKSGLASKSEVSNGFQRSARRF